jgi:hypothetical protein
MIMHTPPRQLLDQALKAARRRGRSVFVYRYRDGWRIVDKLAEAAGATVIEVAPDHAQGETRNQGGC